MVYLLTFYESTGGFEASSSPRSHLQAHLYTYIIRYFHIYIYVCVRVLDTGLVCFAVSSSERIAQIDQVACCTRACLFGTNGNFELKIQKNYLFLLNKEEACSRKPCIHFFSVDGKDFLNIGSYYTRIIHNINIMYSVKMICV